MPPTKATKPTAVRSANAPAPSAPVAPPPAPLATPASPPVRVGESGLSKASKILLLVGAILSTGLAVMMVGMAIFMGAVFSEFEAEAQEQDPSFRFPGPLFLAFYGIWGLLYAAGAVCAFVGWRKASAGDLDSGFVWGLIGSLLPPFNVVILLGAIFAKVCPEAEAKAHSAAGSAPR